MQFRRKSDGALITEQEIRVNHPNTSFPAVLGKEELELAGVDVVFATPQPTPTSPLKLVQANGVVQDNLGNWTQAWIEVDRFPAGEAKQSQEAAYLADLLAQKINNINTRINAARVSREQAGLTYTFPDAVQGTVQTRNDTDIRNIQALTTTAMLFKSEGVTSPLPFRDAEDVLHILTPDQTIQLGMAVQSFIGSTYQWAWGKKALAAQLTLETVDGFVI